MTRFGATLPRAGALAAALCLSTAALAADLPSRVAPPVVPVLPEPVFNWTGFYIGGSLGADIAHNTWNTNYAGGDPAVVGVPTFPGIFPFDGTTPASFGSTRFRVGGYVGYNYQIERYVLGVEGDAAFDAGGTRSVGYVPGTLAGATVLGGPDVDTTSASSRWDASIRGRLGYAVLPNLLLYATGGAAFRDARYTVNCPGNGLNASACAAPEFASYNTSRVGWTVGGGVEYAFTENLIGRAEYRYSDFGRRTLSFFNPGNNFGGDAISATTRLSASTAYVGLAYKFGAPAAPVVARY